MRRWPQPVLPRECYIQIGISLAAASRKQLFERVNEPQLRNQLHQVCFYCCFDLFSEWMFMFRFRSVGDLKQHNHCLWFELQKCYCREPCTCEYRLSSFGECIWTFNSTNSNTPKHTAVEGDEMRFHSKGNATFAANIQRQGHDTGTS